MIREKKYKNEQDDLVRLVRKKSVRKIRSRRKNKKGLLFGLGLFGLVGWSVSIPSLLLLALGIWIDRNYPGPYSWTLMLLILGMMTGCWNAWYWINKESKGVSK